MKSIVPKSITALFPFALVLPVVPLLPITCHAQVIAAASRLDDVVVTATRSEQTLEKTLAQVAIITREELLAAGNTSLIEILQRRAGLEIRVTGGAGQPAGVFIRGASSQQTLVLIDGLRVGSSTSGSTAFENIPLDLIERIEIVKGSLSGLYGSDAIGGVIQIFTRAAADRRLTAAVGAGSDSGTAANAGFSVREGSTAFTLDAGYDATRAKSATNPAAGTFTYNADRDPYRNTHGLVKLSHTLWQGETLSLAAWQSRGKTDFDSGPGSASNRQTLSGYQLTSENNFASDWQSRLMVGKTHDDSVITSSFGGRIKTTQDQASWLNTFKTALGQVNAGIEWRREKLASDTNYDAQVRDTRSLFAGYAEKLAEGQLEFNLRRDEEEQYGRRNTGSAAYGITLLPGWSGYLRVGRGFRAPSFNDLYYPGFSNPLLKPERSDQAEAGLRYMAAGNRLELAHFENRIDDLIVFDTATFLPQNLKRARITGWEMHGNVDLSAFTIRAALTVQQPEDRDSGRQLRSRARQFGSLGALYRVGAWELGADTVASGHRFDSANENATSRMAGYALLNANLRYKIDKNLSVDVAAGNLTNKHYELAKGYNTPSRSVFVTLRAQVF